jgi:hypothetical protein
MLVRDVMDALRDMENACKEVNVALRGDGAGNVRGDEVLREAHTLIDSQVRLSAALRTLMQTTRLATLTAEVALEDIVGDTTLDARARDRVRPVLELLHKVTREEGDET